MLSVHAYIVYEEEQNSNATKMIKVMKIAASARSNPSHSLIFFILNEVVTSI